ADSAAKPRRSTSRRCIGCPSHSSSAKLQSERPLVHCGPVLAMTIMSLVKDRGGSRMAAQQKVAVVTGAGTGIGRAVALALMRAGYADALAGRRASKLEETAAQGRATNRTSLAVPTGVSDPTSADASVGMTRYRPP